MNTSYVGREGVHPHGCEGTNEQERTDTHPHAPSNASETDRAEESLTVSSPPPSSPVDASTPTETTAHPPSPATPSTRRAAPLVDVIVDVVTRSPNHRHRRGSRFITSRETREIRATVAKALESQTVPDVAPLIVKMTRLSPGTLDTGGNLENSQKPVRDQTAAWLKTDDSPRSPIVSEWRCTQTKADKFGVRIQIFAARGAGPRPPAKPRKVRAPRPPSPPKPRKLSAAAVQREADIRDAKGLKVWRRIAANALLDGLEDDANAAWRDAHYSGAADPPTWRETLIPLNAATSTGAIYVQRRRVRDGTPSTLASEIVVVHRRSPVVRWDGVFEYLSVHTRFTYRGRSRLRSKGVAVSLLEAAPVGGACFRFVVDQAADIDPIVRAELLGDIADLEVRVAALVPPSVGVPLPAPPPEPLPPKLVPGGYVDRETGAAVDHRGRPLDPNATRRGRATKRLEVSDDDEGAR